MESSCHYSELQLETVGSTGVSVDSGFITNNWFNIPSYWCKIRVLVVIATKFIHRSFGEELKLCQRYFITTDTENYIIPLPLKVLILWELI